MARTTNKTQGTNNTQSNVTLVTNNSIINVTVNGLTVNQAIADVKIRLECVEKSAFNIALLCAYSLGDTIPAYTDNKGIAHAEATCDKPIKKQADLLKLIGRSKATLSRWIKAIRLIIEKGYFNDFANGKFPFSYDKVIVILENADSFKGYVFSDLMTMTVDSLEAMADKPKQAEAEAEEPSAEADADAEKPSEAEASADTEADASADVEIAIISYNGKDYKVNKSAFEKWLADNVIAE